MKIVTSSIFFVAGHVASQVSQCQGHSGAVHRLHHFQASGGADSSQMLHSNDGIVKAKKKTHPHTHKSMM